MAVLTHVFMTLLLSAAFAEGKYKGPVQEPPGGARADHYLYKQWETMIRPAKFPLLPAAKELKTKDLGPQDKRQRYIFHLDVRFINLKEEIFDDGYYYFAYNSKEQGQLWIVVHPKFRKCFDDLKKKFDLMQSTVFVNGEIEGWPQIVFEHPRQCFGDLKETGSKLPTAKGDLE